MGHEQNNSKQDQTSNLPAIDIFLNPSREEEKEKVIKKKKDIAKTYFEESDMETLYPELFHLLWESTLPCFKDGNKDEHMLLSCELLGVKVNCSDIFTKVPTDVGMCCALNVEDSLEESEYKNLVKELQGDKTTQKVESQEGARNGQRLQAVHQRTSSVPHGDGQEHSTSAREGALCGPLCHGCYQWNRGHLP